MVFSKELKKLQETLIIVLHNNELGTGEGPLRLRAEPIPGSVVTADSGQRRALVW